MYICDNISLNYSFLMINVLDKFDEEIKNAHFIFNIFFLKIMPLTRQCGKIWLNQAGRQQYKMVQALCMLDN